MQAESNLYLFRLKVQDPGSGRKTPTMWHGTGAYHGVFIPETQYCTENANIHPTILLLAWEISMFSTHSPVPKKQA